MSGFHTESTMPGVLKVPLEREGCLQFLEVYKQDLNQSGAQADSASNVAF